MAFLLLATTDGLIIGERAADDWRITLHFLAGREVTSVIAREGVILAGTTQGVFRSDDRGQSWREASQGLTRPHVRWLAYHPGISDLEFAGTEPAGIFVSHTGGERWRECAEVNSLREQGGWYLPYSPEAGCVRGFAFHSHRGYAAVEVGGVLVSNDQGETWQVAKGSTGTSSLAQPSGARIASDVHMIEVHPSSSDLVFAPTHMGLYRSADGGETWTNLYPCYCRAAWSDPVDPEHIVFGPADDVDANGRLETTHDGGRTWQRAALPESPWRDYMVERLAQVDDELVAVLSNGLVLAAPLTAFEWRRILPTVTNAAAVAAMLP